MIAVRVYLVVLSFFFFQAEDGIRDGTVTGVQTCALPILVETELRELGEKRQVSIQMSLEAIHTFKPRIDETEGHHRGERDGGVVKHGEFVDEIAVGEIALDSPGVAFVGQEFLADSQLVAEERELLLLRFEISE